MTNDEKERDAAIEHAMADMIFAGGDRDSWEFGFIAGWNASRKHRDLQIADELDSILTSYGDNDRINDVHDYIEQLREGTK